MLKLAAYFARLILYAFFAISIGLVLLYKFVDPPFTWLMIERGFERKFDGKSWKLEKQWAEYDSISPNFKKAVLAGEDQLFFKHAGFDIEAIRKAYKRNTKGYPIRGGSTISQQTAKNVFLWPGRSWLRKGFEAYFTILIELLWGKERILEVYINVIEMGDGIYGVKEATRFYYQKNCDKMSTRHAAALASVIPSPLRWSPVKPDRRVRKRQRIIRISMRYIHLD